eukprot:scaffold54863_cov31-Tisochrysis_lutea.AAC.1
MESTSKTNVECPPCPHFHDTYRHAPRDRTRLAAVALVATSSMCSKTPAYRRPVMHGRRSAASIAETTSHGMPSRECCSSCLAASVFMSRMALSREMGSSARQRVSTSAKRPPKDSPVFAHRRP